MTDTTTDVKEFLRSKISDLRAQLKDLEDAEFKAKTNMLVGRCYRYDASHRGTDGVERVLTRELMKVVDAVNGDVVVISMKFGISTGIPDIDVLKMSPENAKNFMARCDLITADEFAYMFRAQILSLTRAATGEDLRFEISGAQS